MKATVPFTKDMLTIPEVPVYIDSLCRKIRTDVHEHLHRRGGVIGVSGGIDSSVTLALTVRALGNNNVIALMLPEKDSSPESLEYGKMLAEQFHVPYYIEHITGALEGFQCYARRDQAVKKVFPQYDPNKHTFKIGQNEGAIETSLPSVFYITLVDEKGEEQRKRLPAPQFLKIIASSNFKQRTRMSMLYHYAESHHYAVIGTANKHEINQGFFVKNGDGSEDILPIGNLYKTQVYQLAEYLSIPEQIIHRTPTTDTYPAEQTQEEFFFQLPFQELDLLWHAYEKGYEAEAVAGAVNKTPERVANIFASFRRKQQTTDYQRKPPIIYDGKD